MKLSRIASGLRIKTNKQANCSYFKKYVIFDLDDVLADPNPKRIAILSKPGEPDWVFLATRQEASIW